MTAKRKGMSGSWVDPDEGPEWTQEHFERAAFYRAGELIRPATGAYTKPGRPKLAKPKRQVTLRLDSDVLESFRQTGPGWQSRINEVLRNAVKAS